MGFHAGDDLMEPSPHNDGVLDDRCRSLPNIGTSFLDLNTNLKGSWFEAWKDKKRVRKAPNRCRF